MHWSGREYTDNDLQWKLLSIKTLDTVLVLSFKNCIHNRSNRRKYHDCDNNRSWKRAGVCLTRTTRVVKQMYTFLLIWCSPIIFPRQYISLDAITLLCQNQNIALRNQKTKNKQVIARWIEILAERRNLEAAFLLSSLALLTSVKITS